jgi:peptidoglycan-associated lipoprotein
MTQTKKPTIFNLIFTGCILCIGFIVVGGCSFTQKIRDGQTALELKQYAKAAKLFEEEYNRARTSPEKAQKAYDLGISYNLLRQFDQSSKWFKTSSDLGYGSDATAWYARTLMNLENYELAAKEFLKAGQLNNNERQYIAEINTSKIAFDWLKNADQSPYKIHKLNFNSAFFDYAPSPFDDGKLFFTSDRPQSLGNQLYKMTDNKFSSFFIANLGSIDAERFDEVFNTQYNDASLALNYDKSTAVFVRCGSSGKMDDYCHLYISYFDFGTWSEPEIMSFTKPNINYRYPSFSSDGKILLFSSDSETNIGVFDLYASEFHQGNWLEPIPLSSPINTNYNEISPFMFYDTLYFASDRLGGMGGYDIYRSFLIDGKWSSPQNLKAPINSGFDDFNLVIDTFSKRPQNVLYSGYIVSNRKGGFGADDIYYFEMVQKVKTQEEIDKEKEKELAESRYKIRLELITQEKEFNIPDDPNSGIRFRKPMGNTSVLIYTSDSLIQTVQSNSIGQINLELQLGKLYKFIGTKEMYLSNSLEINTDKEEFKNRTTDTLIQGRLLLEKIYYNKEIVLQDIYYDFDRWEIRSDARPTLDSLAILLTINPNIKITLGSHTDCRGTEIYNQELSQKRAESVVSYLIEKGIKQSRLEPIGYGKSKPIQQCICEQCTEQEHQLNRRTTFAIIQ